MRILAITNLYPPVSIGGYEQICHDVNESLRARGHEVRVLTSNWKKDGLAYEPGVLRKLQLRDRWDDIAERRSGLPNAANSLAVQVRNVRVIGEEVKAFDPDVTVMWNGLHTGQAALLRASKSRALVYYLSDAWLSGIVSANNSRRGLAGAAHSISQAALSGGSSSLRLTNGIFCSQSLLDQYARQGAVFDNPIVIHHGIDPARFPVQRPRIASKGGADPLKVLFVGQIVREKGVLTLVRALAAVRRMPGLEATSLSLFGVLRHEDYATELHYEISSAGLDSAVAITTVPRSQVSAAYGSHDVLAFTSEWEEPFSLTLLEAMASGIPVVSSLRGGSAEIVRDGENALAFAAGDPQDLAVKLATVLSDRALAIRLGQNAAADVRRSFTIEQQVDAVERYLQGVAPG